MLTFARQCKCSIAYQLKYMKQGKKRDHNQKTLIL